RQDAALRRSVAAAPRRWRGARARRGADADKRRAADGSHATPVAGRPVPNPGLPPLRKRLQRGRCGVGPGGRPVDRDAHAPGGGAPCGSCRAQEGVPGTSGRPLGHMTALRWWAQPAPATPPLWAGRIARMNPGLEENMMRTSRWLKKARPVQFRAALSLASLAM